MLLQTVLAASALLLSADEPVFGRAEYAVVVHPSNAEQSITQERLRRILRAEIQEWSSKTSVVLLIPRSGSEAKEALLERVYGMTDLQLKKYWTQLVYQNRIPEAPLAVPSTAVTLQVLARSSGSISVIPVEELSNEDSASVVAIDGKLPGDEGYPLWRQVQPPNPTITSVLDPDLPIELASSGAPKTQFTLARPASYRPTDAPEDNELSSHDWSRATLGEFPSGEIPLLNLRAFAHMEAETERERTEDGTAHNFGFSVESLDLLLTAALGARTSALAETVIEAQDEGGFEIELERLLLRHRFNDAATVYGGRFLTAIGYWNTRYHHGEWLQTSVDRPEVLDFEDDSGLLPIHNVGIGLTGTFFGEAGSFDYTVELANGRGPTPDSVQVKSDGNDLKALNFSVGVEPAAIPGLRIGGGVYFDDIPENDDEDLGETHDKLDEQILNLFFAYNDINWEIFAEYFDLEHDNGQATASSSGWYAQVGKHCGDWTPYVRLDGIDRDEADEFYDSAEDSTTYALGLRFDAVDWAALTLQYEFADFDAPDGEFDEETRTLVLQASFTF